MMRKILYSPGFGAGWVSWARGESVELRSFMLEYQPFIEALEAADDRDMTTVTAVIPGQTDFSGKPSMMEMPRCLAPLLGAFVSECEERFGDVPYLGGIRDLSVYEVEDGVRVRIEEYDGSESVVTDQDNWEWL